MELFFSLSPALSGERRDEILESLRAALPQAGIACNNEGTELRVSLPATADRLAAADAVSLRLLCFGIEAREAARYAPPPAVEPIMGFPHAPVGKKPRTVRLSIFVLSLVAVALVFSVLAFSLGAALSGIFGGATLGTDGTEDYSGKIALVDQLFSEYALYDTNGDLLLDSMLKAYAAATGDRYAAYYTAEEFREITAENNGELVGIGITVVEGVDPAGIVVVGVMPSSPAEVAGVLPGDVIITVGAGETAVSVAEKGYEAASVALRGEAGTVAEFTVLREGREIPFSITRALVENISVTGRVSETDNTVGIVRITQFMISTPKHFVAAMDQLIASGCTRFVFDVRNNPGGDLNSIVAVLSYFLNEGDLIVSIVEKDGTTEKIYAEPVTYGDAYADCNVSAEEIGKYRDFAKAVLINGNTASAAELFTAVLSDYSLATVVGTTTYGKGVLQHIFDLSNWGYSGAVKLTTGYYNPPSGVNYDGKGISPHGGETPLDDAVKHKNLYLLTEAEDNQLRAAIAAAKQ